MILSRFPTVVSGRPVFELHPFQRVVQALRVSRQAQDFDLGECSKAAPYGTGCDIWWMGTYSDDAPKQLDMSSALYRLSGRMLYEFAWILHSLFCPDKLRWQ